MRAAHIGHIRALRSATLAGRQLRQIGGYARGSRGQQRSPTVATSGPYGRAERRIPARVNRPDCVMYRVQKTPVLCGYGWLGVLQPSGGHLSARQRQDRGQAAVTGQHADTNGLFARGLRLRDATRPGHAGCPEGMHRAQAQLRAESNVEHCSDRERSLGAGLAGSHLPAVGDTRTSDRPWPLPARPARPPATWGGPPTGGSPLSLAGKPGTAACSGPDVKEGLMSSAELRVVIVGRGSAGWHWRCCCGAVA